MKKIIIKVLAALLIVTPINIEVQALLCKEQYEVESTENVQEIMETLCSDKCRGRVVATDENLRAAQYIENYFTSIGLDIFDGDSFYNETGLRYRGKENFAINNVVGVIKGTEGENAVFLTAHFDHIVGQNGQKLMGAIDNASGISVILQTARKLSAKAKEKPLKGEVVAVGNGTKDEEMVVKNGDTVLYGKYAGTEIELDGEKYLIMRQSDILAII